MENVKIKRIRRRRRKKRVRKTIFGTANRPRLTVFRSAKHMYAQVIDDAGGITLCAASTRDPSLAKEMQNGGNKAAATSIGAALAQAMKNKGIEKATFDRNGFAYHGRVKALAQAVRDGGVKL